MHISIVIPSYNTQDVLAATLEKLCQQVTKLQFEILVVDCSSHNEVKAICEHFSQATYIQVKERFNPGIGRNIGAEKALGELLIFVDADVHLTDNALDNAYQHYKSGAKVFGGALELNTAVCADSAAYLEHYFFNHESQAGRPACERSNLSSAFMCFDRELFIRCGGFKDIPRMQDTELTERLIKTENLKLHFFPDVIALQIQDSPMGKVFRKIYINGQNVYYIRYQNSASTLKKLAFAILLPAIGLAKTLRIIGRHLKYQPFSAKLKTLFISPLLLCGGAVWTYGFYHALITNKGMSKGR